MSNFCHEFDKDYLPASFKGVPFFVDTISDSSGRRGVVGEFPRCCIASSPELRGFQARYLLLLSTSTCISLRSFTNVL